jgi:DnaJ family protein C protein 3
LQKAQQRQKLSETRDYYKILNVPRTAKKQQIIKAYRKAAQKWHPDNFPDEEEKKRAEKKFIDIAAAKEVLTDDEKRAKFDRGEDPLDPESGKHQGQGFNPFQDFHHFQGSPFQFKFHFN